MKEKYGFAVIDGRKESVGNYVVETPGLFLGRGDHPKAGLLKTRIFPKDLTLNLGEKAPVPKAENGEKYGTIVHNHEAGWLAMWRPNISGSPKYVMFSSNSSLKGQSDQKKFDKAKNLGKNIERIRKDYTKDLISSSVQTQQKATAIWIIDHLALRVGGDKGDDEADTVGCTSLRFEHIRLYEPSDVEFDFLGKDSMRYLNRVKVDKQVFKNIKSFTKGKRPGDDIFDQLNPSILNAHLSSLMPGLTAKVFRTFNASTCMQQQLDKYDIKKNANMTADEKLLFFNTSSVEVAILCNHKRSVAATFDVAVGKLEKIIVDARAEIKDLEENVKRLKQGKSPLPRGKDAEGFPLKSLPGTVEATEKRIEAALVRIKKTELKMKDKDNQKEISTSTSKVNYIDPRISITWCHKVGLDVSKIFPKTLRDKFGWAMADCIEKPKFRF